MEERARSGVAARRRKGKASLPLRDEVHLAVNSRQPRHGL
jgi:hypothetical protein